MAVEHALERILDMVDQVRAQAQQDRLRLRVAEARV
jgi:hypothetical protein